VVVNSDTNLSTFETCEECFVIYEEEFKLK